MQTQNQQSTTSLYDEQFDEVQEVGTGGAQNKSLPIIINMQQLLESLHKPAS